MFHRNNNKSKAYNLGSPGLANGHERKDEKRLFSEDEMKAERNYRRYNLYRDTQEADD